MHPFLFHFRCDFLRLRPLLESCWRLHLAAIIVINTILSLTVTHSAGPQWKKEMRKKSIIFAIQTDIYEFSLLFRNAHYLPFYWVSFSVGLCIFFRFITKTLYPRNKWLCQTLSHKHKHTNQIKLRINLHAAQWVFVYIALPFLQLIHFE